MESVRYRYRWMYERKRLAQEIELKQSIKRYKENNAWLTELLAPKDPKITSQSMCLCRFSLDVAKNIGTEVNIDSERERIFERCRKLHQHEVFACLRSTKSEVFWLLYFFIKVPV